MYAFLRTTLGPALRAAVRLQTEGVENLPLSGPVLLASNHLSITDSTFLPLAIPRPVTFMAKAEYFTGRTLLGRLTSRFMAASGQVPVQRDNQRAAVASLETCFQVLKDGGVFCINPEGTRSPDGRLYRGRTGVAWLALKSGAPVIPVAMFGTDRVLPPGRTLPRPARVRVTFGKPIELGALDGDPGSARSRRTATDAITAAIAQVSGQDRVRQYARP